MTAGQLDLIDGGGLAEVAERRGALAQAAGVVMDAVTRDNTRRAFADDWRAWTEFCVGMSGRIEPNEPSEDSLVMFAVWLGQGGTWTNGSERKPSSPATIIRRLTGVCAGWKKTGHVLPRGITAKARQVVDAYQRQLVEAQLPTGRGQAPALTVAQIRRIAATTPTTLAGRRDLALVLIGFAIAGRRSEVAHLQVADFIEEDNGLLVHVRHSKTKPRRPAVVRGQVEATCPVRAWKRWQEASGITAGPAFRRVDRHGRVLAGLSGEAVGEIIGRAGERAGLELRLTGHSVRAGLATEARRVGHDVVTIARQGGWDERSAALHGYLRIVDQWTDNATAGIGL